MANTDVENQMVRNAVGVVTSRYGAWISRTPSTLAFFDDVKGPQIASWVKFLDSDPFMRNLNVFGMHKTSANCTVCGFCAPVVGHAFKKEMYINRSAAGPGTLVHELLHFFTHPAFTMYVPATTNEAVTEYFTRKSLSRSTDVRFTGADRSRNYAMAHMALGFGRPGIKKSANHQKDYMKKAYFQGDIACIGLINTGLSELPALVAASGE